MAQLVIQNNRVIAHGTDCFLCMGGTVVCTVTGRTFQNASVVEVDCALPADIDNGGYEYKGGCLYPCSRVLPNTAAELGLPNGASVDTALAKMGGAAFLGQTPKYTLVQNASQLPVGASVPINVGGIEKEFIVIQQGKPSSVYADNCNGTWLMMKEAYTAMALNTARTNDYGNSSMHTYLNGTFYNLLDDKVKAKIQTATIPYVYWRDGGYIVETGTSGLSTKVFLLSRIETGHTVDTYTPQDGSKLAYFTGNESLVAYNSAGTAVYWWTRSSYLSNTSTMHAVGTSGAPTALDANRTDGYARPVFVISGDISDFGFYTDGKYVFAEQEFEYELNDALGKPVELPGTHIEIGSYNGTGTCGSGNRSSLTFAFEPKIVFIQRTDTSQIYALTAIYGSNYASGIVTSGSSADQANYGGQWYVFAYWSRNAFEWYANDASTQLNTSGATYRYVAIG